MLEIACFNLGVIKPVNSLFVILIFFCNLSITQISTPISFEERRALDLYYIQNWSFWLDLQILFRTIAVVLTGKGAK